MREHTFSKQRKGTTAVILSSMALIVFLLLGTGAVQMGLFSRPAENAQFHWLQARFLAQSGADAFAHWMVGNPESLTEVEMDERLSAILAQNQGKSEPVSLDELPDGNFIITLNRIDENRLRITSTGEYQSVTEQLTITLERTPDGAWQRAEDET